MAIAGCKVADKCSRALATMLEEAPEKISVVLLNFLNQQRTAE